MNIEQAIDEAAHASDARLRKSYEVALAHGATNTACRPDEERLYGTVRLMTLAILRLPDLAMIAQLMHMNDEDRVVMRVACDVAGGALRLAHRALETHGRDVGYEIGAWIDDASQRSKPAASSVRARSFVSASSPARLPMGHPPMA
jgi:hypothetical protein